MTDQLVSYAQNFEDILLNRVFGGKRTGFYVDIGAYKPVEGSVTKLFYDRGWSGINVEPGSAFEELQAARPRDVNLRMAVLDRTGEVAFFEDTRDRGTSHVTEETGTATVTVPCDTLERIIEAHANGRVIDFLKVDAEGSEGAIVRSTDWRIVRPPVLVFEATRPWSTTLANQDWEPVLQEQGYSRVFFDGINCFYVPEELAASLAPHFAAPINVLDRAVRADQVMREQALIVEREELRQRLTSAEQALAEFDDQAKAAAGRTSELERQLEVERADGASLRQRLDQTESALALMRREAEVYHRRLDEDLAVRDTLRQRLQQTEAEMALMRQKAERDDRWLEQERAAHEISRQRLQQAESEIALIREQTETEMAILRNLAEQERHKLASELAARDSLQEPRQLQLSASTALADSPSEPSLETAPARMSFGARLLQPVKVIAWSGYRLIRPIVRPIAWRTRNFLMVPISQAIEQVRDVSQPDLSEALRRALDADMQAKQQAMQSATRNAEILVTTAEQTLELVRQSAEQTANLVRQSVEQAAELTRQSAAQNAEQLRQREEHSAEFGRITGAIENALLTLTLESASRRPKSAPLAAGGPTQAIARLNLPQGRAAELLYFRSDMSVGGPIAASGEWEPHMRRLLERTVQPDWTCLDVGANIGAHTMSLASLAYMGQVIGFEADPANHALLAHNVAALGGAVADTEVLNLALWDSPGRLRLGRVDEFTGCSFVSAGALDEADVEKHLRDVVDPAATKGRALSPRTSEVEAATLDGWVKEKALQRVDLIKIDAEGAESRILSGARDVLKRFRPLVLVEYNPDCASVHFKEEPDTLYRALAECFDDLGAIERDGTVTAIEDWESLKARLDSGKGWEDLVCGFA
ncbi:FkbM family methyltransferase [Aurantimonas endophytica]|nr:FkbM family methyltransferase [Aurantimonas endophytica]